MSKHKDTLMQTLWHSLHTQVHVTKALHYYECIDLFQAQETEKNLTRKNNNTTLLLQNLSGYRVRCLYLG